MFGITAFIALPLRIFINNLWLNNLATRIEMAWSNLGIAIIIVLVIVGFAILGQILKTDRRNLVNFLKDE